MKVASKRLKAFLLHACASLLAACATLFLVFGVWYPSPLHKATGVMNIYWLVLAVDVVLGPLLTLVVSSPSKARRALLFDWTVIVLAQLIMLGYGLHAVAQGRPAWLVFAVDRFELVRVSDYDHRRVGDALPQFRSPGWSGPGWAGTSLPTAGKERTDLLWDSLQGGFDLPQRPDHYRPLTELKSGMQARMQPLKELDPFNETGEVRANVARYPQADAWLPLAAPEKSMVVLLRKDTAEVQGVIDLRPWKD